MKKQFLPKLLLNAPKVLYWSIFVLIFFVASFFSFTAKINAASGINPTINFQGKVVNKTAGTNVTDGNYDFTFRLYDAASSGTLLWTENYTGGNQVAVTDGIFRVALGSLTSLSSVDFNSDSLYLDITFNGEAMGTRVRFASVPYAFNAQKVNGLAVTNNGGNTLNIAASKTFTVNDTVTLEADDGSTLTFQGTDTYVGRTTTDVLTNKTIGSTGLIFSGASTDITTDTDEDLTIDTNGSGSLILSDNTNVSGLLTLSSGLTLSGGGAITLGGSTGSGQCLLGGSNATWGSCGGSSSSSPWNVLGGALSPVNIGNDFLLGSQATTSAKFAVTGMAGAGPATASVSGNMIIQPFNGAGGNLGIRTNNPLYALDVNGASRISGNSGLVGTSGYALSIQDNSSSSYLEILNNGGAGKGAFFGMFNNDFEQYNYQGGPITFFTDVVASSYQERMRISANGTLGLGTGSPMSEFHVTRPLAFGATGKALAVLDQIENQDIFTASSSGISRFVVKNNGNLGIGETTILPDESRIVLGGISSLEGGQLQWNPGSSGSVAWFTDIYDDNFRVMTGTKNSSSTVRMTIDDSGQVNIGSDVTPNALFTVGSTSQFQVNSSGAIAAATGLTLSSGAITLGGSTGSGQCLNGGSTAAWGSCGGGSSIPNVVYMSDSGDVTWTDTSTTELWSGGTKPNITPSSASNAVLIMVSIKTLINPGSTSADSAPAARIEGDTGSTASCSNSNNVGTPFGYTWSDDVSNANAPSQTLTYVTVDEPATTSNRSYTICTSTNSVLAGTNTKKTIDVTLMEVTNNADLAEIYPTLDATLGAGEVVALDSSMQTGVRRSKVGDKNALGVVSTAPALTIGGTNGESNHAVPVALSGRVPVKVSTINGEIKKGDIITVSSIPGVAMRATKAGNMLGIAMEDYSGQGVGKIMIFVKSGNFNGGNLAEIVQVKTDKELSLQVLDYLKELKPDESQVSEIFTDRLAAGLEIITPKLVSENVILNNLSTLPDSDLVVKLFSGKYFKVKNDKADLFSLDESGNASLSGILSSEGIKTNNLVSKNIISEDLNITNLAINNSASISGNLRVKSDSIFEGIVSIMGSLKVNKFSVSGISNFMGDVLFKENVKFNNNFGGYAVIEKGEDEVEVKFTKTFEATPIVNTNMLLGNIENDKEKDIIEGNYSYFVSHVEPNGFIIKLNKEAKTDLNFSWSAVSIDKPLTVHNEASQSADLTSL